MELRAAFFKGSYPELRLWGQCRIHAMAGKKADPVPYGGKYADLFRWTSCSDHFMAG